jgi:G3E family GTPase
VLSAAAHAVLSDAAHAALPDAACAPGVHAHRDGDPVHGTQFESWSCRPQQVFDAQALRAWLSAPPAGVLRLKGVLRTATQDKGSHTWAQVQFAGRHGSLRSTGSVKDGAAVVAIGLRGLLPTAALASFFDPASH